MSKVLLRLTVRRIGCLFASVAILAATAGGARAGQAYAGKPYAGRPQLPAIRPWKNNEEAMRSWGKIEPQQAAGAQTPKQQDVMPSATKVEQLPEIPAIPEVPRTPETIDKVLKLEDEGERYFALRQLDKALAKWQEAYGLSLEMKYSDGEGRALRNMCRVYLERGQFVKAKELGENALELLANSGDKKALGKARVALAQAYLNLDNAAWAGQQLQLALQTFTELGSQDAQEAAQALTLAGTILVKRGAVKEALSLYQSAAGYYGQARDPYREISTRVSLIGMMQELGWLVASMEEARKTLDIARNLKDPDVIAQVLTIYAGCQYNLGELAAARASYEEALKIGARFPDELVRAQLEAGYGHALAATGDLEQAKEHLDKAAPAIKTRGSVFAQAQVYNTLGNVEELIGHHARAVTLLNQALDLQQIMTPKQDRFRAVILQNLAAAEFRAGEYRSARDRLSAALPLFKSVKDETLHGRTFAAMGEICLTLKDVAQAEQYLRQGIAVSEKINDDAALWRDYTLLAQIQLNQGLTDQARESLTSALSFFRSPQAGAFASPERLGFPSSREDLGHKLVSTLVSQGMLEQALLAAEQLKEESFIHEWHRRGGEVKKDDRDVYNDLVTQRAHLHAAEASTTPDKLIKEWQSWLGRFRQLAADNRALARLIAPVPTTLAEIFKEVQRNKATVIDYLVGPHTTVVFVIDTAGRLSADVLKVGRAELQPQVTSLLANSTGASGQQSERRLLEMLYAELLPESVRSALPGNPDETVVIIPDGILFNLPFAALLDGQGKYLVENHTLTMASSMGVFLDSPPRYSHDMSVVVASTGAADPQALRTREETSAIFSLFEPELVTRLVGKDAELTSFEEQAKGKAVVHFAAGMQLPASNPLRSVVPVLSGKESKKVTADRLFEMSLPSDLVVWSASAVNTKDLQGNAVKLFSRGLSYAGVRNVMMSLWVEPDPQRTAELVEFYKSNRQGLTQAQSLRRAQLIALSRDPSPRSWAAFQLLGPGH